MTRPALQVSAPLGTILSSWPAVIARNAGASGLAGGLVWLAMTTFKVTVLGSSYAPGVAMVAADIVWVILAVLANFRTGWRLFLVWSPVIGALVMALYASETDDTGLSPLLYMMVMGMLIGPSVLGTIAVVAYRPGELAAEGPQ